MSVRQMLVSMALSSLAAAHAQAAEAPPEAMEVCYGVAMQGHNDCADTACFHSCSGMSQHDRDPSEWTMVPKGTCISQGGQVAAQPKACATPPAANGQVADLTAGGELFAAGDQDAKVPACSACHGAAGVGGASDYPALAGQNASYLARQLRHFRSAERADPVMNTATRHLNDAQIDNLSAYLAAQQPLTAVDKHQAQALEQQLKGSAHADQPRFSDCAVGCPDFIAVPAGSFLMGSPTVEAGRFGNEQQHVVVITQAFAISTRPITFAQWDQCVSEGGCGGYRPSDEGFGRGERPVINVSTTDIASYIAWLQGKTGQHYALPSEAQWEYAARAGTTTARSWGNDIARRYANYGQDDCPAQIRCPGRAEGADRWVNTAPTGSFPANPWGLYDMLGNVWQRTADCWHADYTGAPQDERAWTEPQCERSVIRGGSWSNVPAFVRSASRAAFKQDGRARNIGFRLTRTL